MDKSPGGREQKLAVAALFAGIGGVELGLHRTGKYTTTYFSEIEPGACEVLKKQFQGTPNVGGIEKLERLTDPGDVHVVTAGFPCQDLSQAGRTAGINGSKSGIVARLLHLLDVADGSIPWVLIENVPFMLQLDQGEAMHFLTSRLEQAGFRWAYRVIDSRSMGVPQRRRRVFLLASTEIHPESVLFRESATPGSGGEEHQAFGFYWTEGTRGIGWAPGAIPTLKGGSGLGIPSPPAIWIPEKGIFTPGLADAEALQGFPEGWTSPAANVEGFSDRHRWKLLGNAVTVPVAEWVGEQLFRTPEAIDSTQCFEISDGESWPAAAFGGDGERLGYRISEWPVAVPIKPLLDVVDVAALKPLSVRAASGFLRRYVAGGLKKDWRLVEALATHVTDHGGAIDEATQRLVATIRKESSAVLPGMS